MIYLKKMNWTPTQVESFQFQREMTLKALHKKNLVKAKKIIVDSVMDQDSTCTKSVFPKDTERDV